MHVEIIRVEPTADGTVEVDVRADVGDFRATWSGAPPPVGAARDVELTIDHRFTWGEDAVPVQAQAHAIAPGEDGGVVILATIEQLDDGGFVGLRIGRSAVMSAADGEPPPVGTTVRLVAPPLTLYDTNI